MPPKIEPLNGPNLSASLEKSARTTAVGQMAMQSKFSHVYLFFLYQPLNTPGDREAVAVISIWGTAAISLMNTSTRTAKRIPMTPSTPPTCNQHWAQRTPRRTYDLVEMHGHARRLPSSSIVTAHANCLLGENKTTRAKKGWEKKLKHLDRHL